MEDLADIAVADKLRAYLRGDAVPVSREQVKALLRQTEGWHTVGQPFTDAMG